MLCSCEGWPNSDKSRIIYLSMFTDFPFSLFLFAWKGYQKKLCNLAFIAAKECIAIHWKVGYPPTMLHWMAEMSSYRMYH
jgi:hypothetical protein